MGIPGFGVVKTTLVDYPPFVSSIIFVPGCNLRCPWCQNPGLVKSPWAPDLWNEEALFAFLDQRRDILQGVVVSGGEPLLWSGISHLLKSLRSLDLKIKLDTNGTLPERLEAVLPWVDYVAMDLKNVPARYAESTGIAVPSSRIDRSLRILEDWGQAQAEVRLTWVPSLNRFEDLADYARIVGRNLPVWVQAYRPGPVLDPTFQTQRSPTPDEMATVVQTLQSLGVKAQRRG